jgi:hypothetical protein
MKLTLLAVLPPVFITLACYALLWMVDPKFLCEERAGKFLPLWFGAMVAFGELLVRRFHGTTPIRPVVPTYSATCG